MLTLKTTSASFLRTLGALAVFTLLSACASLSGGDSAAELSDSDLEAQALKVASLEAEVARLKSQNARLANQVLSFQRERDSAALENETDGDIQQEAEVSLPPAPEAITKDPEPSTAVVDDAASPALAQSEVPVQTSPRLVQPTFASNETVFENEANGEIKTESVLYGVHLASYRKLEEARAGWRQLQRENPDELGLLEPRVENITVTDKGRFLRLIGGGFAAKDKADALCAQLKAKGMFCAVEGFEGERLSLAESDS
ncbi:SPOR domain-containing protein [Hyphococcus flavus]|uniref:SPOR domain-containing protein n=1 Tax=Hyphococcus flavus TaxID=1866326 RepID=A0AAF0CFW5_9PROT|nr:SPOR domain-containing protein [Hyphococcus flavus]WDI31784.1 SPOR domain-containing protein [Hyphococcus flavus]